MTLEFTDPTEWWLKLPLPLQVTAWQQSQRHSTSERRWVSYLNQLCLNVILPWLQTEYAAEVHPWLNSSAVSAVWEVVHGTAIELGSTRMVLIPSQIIDAAELEVPQEWIDIPGWVADYYLAVQVKLDSPEDLWIRVWGYTTHRDLKTKGYYNPDARTYSLIREQLNRDLSTFGLALQYCSPAQTRATTDLLPPLSTAQADLLIQELSRSAISFPRLAVPFAQWGALLEREIWRQQLYQQRLQQASSEQTDDTVYLSQWFQQHFSAGWQSIQALLGTESNAFAFSMRSNPPESSVTRVKQINLGSSAQTVVLLMKLSLEEDRVEIAAQVYPIFGRLYIPATLTLALLSEAGSVLQSVQAGEEDDYIQLKRFRCRTGTPFSLKLVWQSHNAVENFVV